MPPKPAARPKLLDAFVRLLTTQGERAATLDAVAAEAGVSKGGLLYHFPTRNALVDGLVDRARELADDDLAAMRAAPEGAAEYYIRTSNYQDSEFDRVMIAIARLGRDSAPGAGAALAEVQKGWLDALVDQTGDADVARAVMLMGDGLYYRGALESEHPLDAESVDGLVRVIRGLVAGRVV